MRQLSQQLVNGDRVPLSGRGHASLSVKDLRPLVALQFQMKCTPVL